MTKEERYLEVKRATDKRVNGASKRRRRAFIVRAVFAAGAALALYLAVIGTQPRNAARLKRAVFPVISLFTGQADAPAVGITMSDLQGEVDDA